MTKEEQCALLMAWQDNQDQAARDKLILEFMNKPFFLKLCHKIAACARLSFQDVQQELFFPFVKAADKWDRNRGYSFYVVASMYARNHLRELTLDNKEIIKPYRKDKARLLYYKINKIAPDLLYDTASDERIKEVANKLKIAEPILESFIAWNKGYCTYIDDEEKAFDLIDNHNPTPETILEMKEEDRNIKRYIKKINNKQSELFDEKIYFL